MGGPARQGRQPQRHRGAEAHHDTGQRPGTPPEQHGRESDRHDRRERPPGDVVPEDSLEQRRHHQHPQQHPVARHPFGRVGCAGLGPQRAQGVGDHAPSLGTAEASGTDRENETPLLPTAETGPASTPMRPGRRSASVEPPGGEAGPSSKEKSMSRLLYRWGRWSATRPWIAIGAWVLLSVLVVAASAGFGKQLDDSLAAPGTDSQAAADLLAGADSGAGGLTAYVVATPSQHGETFVDSRQARVDLDRLESAVGDLPKVLGTTEEVSPDGRVALVRVQYPEIGELAVSDLAALKAVLAESKASSSLRLEAGGDLYFSFEQPPANVGEVL